MSRIVSVFSKCFGIYLGSRFLGVNELRRRDVKWMNVVGSHVPSSRVCFLLFIK